MQFRSHFYSQMPLATMELLILCQRMECVVVKALDSNAVDRNNEKSVQILIIRHFRTAALIF